MYDDDYYALAMFSDGGHVLVFDSEEECDEYIENADFEIHPARFEEIQDIIKTRNAEYSIALGAYVFE